MSKLTINFSPHLRSDLDIRGMMKRVIIALIPVVAASVYFFGEKAVFVTLSSVAGALAGEMIFRKIRKKKISVGDLSAIVTGLVLAMVMPPAIPLWMAFLGGVFATGMGKELFGGLGHNIFNPALLARAFLMAAFPIALTTWTDPITLDTVTSATPLGLAKFSHVATPYWKLFIGDVSGSLGETSALAILAGGAYLLYKKVIDYRIPLAYAIALFSISWITHAIAPDKFFPPIFHLLAGGFMLGALFMATDPVTSPVTKKGRWIFGAGCGVVTMIIRLWGGMPEGVMFSILLMNAATPLINRLARQRRYGTK